MRTNIPKGLFSETNIITLKDNVSLENYRAAGKIAAGALSLLENLVKEKTTKSLLELDQIAEDFIISHNGLCTFKNYHGFTNCCCISVNRQLVHSIPTDYKLQDGDIVSFDLGCTINGCVGDTAITMIYGEPKSSKHIALIKATEEALTNGIEAIAVGKRLGCIGEAIYKTGKSYGLSVVEAYGGHGLDRASDGTAIPHASPFVCNKDTSDNGIHLIGGMVLAIEPLFVIGNSNKTKTLDDKWTVVCDEVCSHHEHTIFIHEDHVEILTDRTIL